MVDRFRSGWVIGLMAGALVGCRQAAKPVDTSPANAGVNIVPAAVLAAAKMPPDTQPAPDDRPDLVQAISTSDVNHQQLLRALRMSDLVPQLQSIGPYTLLAPTDEAFSKLPPGTMDRLTRPENEAQLKALMQYHLLKGRISLKDMLATNGQVTTMSGQAVVIKGIDQKVMISDANVLRADNAASNGVIYWLDGVLLPPGR